MPAETKKNHSADADRVKEVYKVTIAGSIINVVLLVLKFAAGILGHSAAMIADAIHSLTDFATDVVVLVFVKLGNKPMIRTMIMGMANTRRLPQPSSAFRSSWWV